MVTSVPADCNDPLQYMFSSDSDGSEVSTVRVEDKGSKPQKVWLMFKVFQLKE